MGNKSDKDKNWHAVNLITGEECGHAHHTKETAKRCANVKGWTHAKICTYWKCNKKEGSEAHHTGSKKRKADQSYNRKMGRLLMHHLSEDDAKELSLGMEQEEER